MEKRNIPKLRFKEYIDDWIRMKLGDISKITTGNTPSTGNEEFYNGTKLFVSPSDLNGNRYVTKTKTTLTELGFNQGRIIYSGSILFVCIGSTIGKVGQVKVDCITNQQINALDNNKGFDNNFIFGLLEKNAKKIKLLAGVQAVPQINKTDFSNFKYYFPSLPEQKKIASFLSAVDEKIQQLTRKKELLEQYKKGVMQKLLSAKLRFKDEKGKPYPNWSINNLGPFVQIKSGNSPSKYEFLNKGTYPFLKVEELNNSEKYQSTSRFYTNNNVDIIKKNSIIFPKRGAAILNNKVRINTVEVLIDTNLMALVPLDGKLYYEYLYYKIFSEKLYKIADCSSIPQINNKHIEPYKISIPSFSEQKKIATYLSTIDKKIEVITSQIT